MKTAMQELRDFIYNNDIPKPSESAVLAFKFIELLEKEEEQIKRAVEDSNGITFWLKYKSSQDYYNKNYKKTNNL